jgi:hypothetical protein
MLSISCGCFWHFFNLKKNKTKQISSSDPNVRKKDLKKKNKKKLLKMSVSGGDD